MFFLYWYASGWYVWLWRCTQRQISFICHCALWGAFFLVLTITVMVQVTLTMSLNVHTWFHCVSTSACFLCHPLIRSNHSRPLCSHLVILNVHTCVALAFVCARRLVTHHCLQRHQAISMYRAFVVSENAQAILKSLACFHNLERTQAPMVTTVCTGVLMFVWKRMLCIG